MNDLVATPSATSGTPLSVSALNRRVRECLESNFPLLWVSGEISNLTYAASGHVYFSLKDAQAQVRCVMWRSRAQTLGWRLENGQKIDARALVSFYEPRGEFQLNIESVRRAGQGDLFERFLKLKAQLEKEGLFAVDRKRPLPAFPRHIAIVTSPQAAALRDVLTTLHRRAPHIRITLLPTPVQGEGAAERIANALADAATSGAELVILCRGGGSIEDLWSFNEEAVARAIVRCALPVICGVGHETDFTIADFAADLRAPTPTAAAELASPNRESLLRQLADQQRRLQRHQERSLADKLQKLDWLARRLTHPAERLRQRNDNLEKTASRLKIALQHTATTCRIRLEAGARHLMAARPSTQNSIIELNHLGQKLNQQAHWHVSRSVARLDTLTNSLRQLDPNAVLRRGYALAVDSEGRAVRDAGQLETGQPLTLNFARGQAQVSVNQVVPSSEAE